MTILDQKRVIRTPDRTNFSVAFLDKEQTAEKIIRTSFRPASDEFQLNNGHEILFDASTLELIELFPSRRSYLFTLKDFQLYKEGEHYSDTSIFIEGEKAFVSFSLKPANTIHFLREVEKLEAYKPFDGYIAYKASTEEIIFARHRVNDLYDGYWYPTLDDFEYSYRSFAF